MRRGVGGKKLSGVSEDSQAVSIALKKRTGGGGAGNIVRKQVTLIGITLILFIVGIYIFSVQSGLVLSKHHSSRKDKKLRSVRNRLKHDAREAMSDKKKSHNHQADSGKLKNHHHDTSERRHDIKNHHNIDTGRVQHHHEGKEEHHHHHSHGHDSHHDRGHHGEGEASSHHHKHNESPIQQKERMMNELKHKKKDEKHQQRKKHAGRKKRNEHPDILMDSQV